MSDKNASITLADQAIFIDDLVRRCTLRDGTVSPFACLSLTPFDVEILKHLAERLDRLSFYERDIRRLVASGNTR